MLIHVGNKDVNVKRKTPTDTADSIIGRKCKDAGINQVTVSSIVHRNRSRFQMKINEVNSVLKDLYVNLAKWFYIY